MVNRLLICHFFKLTQAEDFRPNILLSFYKRLVVNVLQVSVIHILDYNSNNSVIQRTKLLNADLL